MPSILRRAVAIVLATSVIALMAPRARADDDVITPRPPEDAPAPRIMLSPAEALALAGGHASQLASLGYLAPSPADVRLSRGAKTAIIVGAIVGGVLLIVGVIALAKPKPLFK